jgi:hypothetical protein
MATIINNPANQGTHDDSAGTGLIVGILLVILVGFLFYFYGLPMLTTTTVVKEVPVVQKIEVQLPAPVTTE